MVTSKGSLDSLRLELPAIQRITFASATFDLLIRISASTDFFILPALLIRVFQGLDVK